MFIIRREQLELLQRQLVEAFERSAIRRMRKKFPKQTEKSNDDHLRLMVRDAMERGEKYGIRDEAEVTAYLELMVSYGRDFDGDPSLRRILRVRNISGTEKMNRIVLIKPPQYEDSAEWALEIPSRNALTKSKKRRRPIPSVNGSHSGSSMM